MTKNDSGVVAVIRTDSPEIAYTLAKAFDRTNVSAIEITMTVPSALDVIKNLLSEGVERLGGAKRDVVADRLCARRIVHDTEYPVGERATAERVASCRVAEGNAGDVVELTIVVTQATRGTGKDERGAVGGRIATNPVGTVRPNAVRGVPNIIGAGHKQSGVKQCQTSTHIGDGEGSIQNIRETECVNRKCRRIKAGHGSTVIDKPIGKIKVRVEIDGQAGRGGIRKRKQVDGELRARRIVEREISSDIEEVETSPRQSGEVEHFQFERAATIEGGVSGAEGADRIAGGQQATHREITDLAGACQ